MQSLVQLYWHPFSASCAASPLSMYIIDWFTQHSPAHLHPPRSIPGKPWICFTESSLLFHSFDTFELVQNIFSKIKKIEARIALLFSTIHVLFLEISIGSITFLWSLFLWSLSTCTTTYYVFTYGMEHSVAITVWINHVTTRNWIDLALSQLFEYIVLLFLLFLQ